jgi:hypothetical protein
MKMWDLCEGNCGFCYPKVYSACKSKKKKERGALSRITLTKQIVKNEIEELDSLAEELFEGKAQNRDYCKKVSRVGEALTEDFDLMKGGECDGSEGEGGESESYRE